MIYVAAFILLFTFSGLPFARLQGGQAAIFLAPAYGLSAIVALGYLISANSGLAGGLSTLFAAATWVLLSTVLFFSKAHRAWLLRFVASGELKYWAYFLAVTVLVLIPALNYGIDKFFGAVNFDFFYNSQDSQYLLKNSVLSFHIDETEIFPIDWSANYQGRFGISLIAAAIMRVGDVTALAINSILISSLIFLILCAFYSFVRIIFGFEKRLAFISAVVMTLSAGIAQSYFYYLLGQMSAIPLFVASLCLIPETIGAIEKKNQVRCVLLVSIFVFNSLYIMYAILFVFSVFITALAVVYSVIANKSSISAIFRTSCYFLLFHAVAFIGIRILNLKELIASISSWIALSVKTGSGAQGSVAVFSEYTLEAFTSLMLGIASYPTPGSIAFGWVDGGIRPAVLLCAGLLACLILLVSIWGYVRAREFSHDKKACVLAIFTVFAVSALVFFYTGSGYSLFKISTWLLPLLIPAVVNSAVGDRQHLALPSFVRLGSGAFITANLLSSLAYFGATLLPEHGSKSVNAFAVNGYPGLAELEGAINAQPATSSLVLDLKNGIRNAWIARALGSNLPTVPLSQNRQPLVDRELPKDACSASFEALNDDSIIITDAKAKDVILDANSLPHFYANQIYLAARWKDVPYYAFIGRGSYPPEQHDGFAENNKFRWVERGVELYYFSRNDGVMNISLKAWPGYVNGPEERTLTLQSGNKTQKAQFSRSHPAVSFANVPVKSGMNCYVLQSDDQITPQLRYGAVFRQAAQADTRKLSFAISSVEFDEKK